ncbi:unnamed protein product, partial [Didymodactylos carnosus]
CPKCGNNGQCFGPNICCSSYGGCRINHPADIKQCSSEDLSPLPCNINSLTCFTVNGGHCTENGVCCNAESCHVDDTCHKQLIDNQQAPIW